MTWADDARRAIAAVHATLPADMGLKERAAAIDAAYPFTRRQYHPYKVWCAERRKYLMRYGYGTRTKPLPMPLLPEAKPPAPAPLLENLK